MEFFHFVFEKITIKKGTKLKDGYIERLGEGEIASDALKSLIFQHPPPYLIFRLAHAVPIFSIFFISA